jgi:hypothetical protein
VLSIHIHNNGTGTTELANYDFEVEVNGKVIADGQIQGHNRKEGWEKLVRMMLEESKKTQVSRERGKYGT